MTTETEIKGLFAAILSLALAWVVFSRCTDEADPENSGDGKQRYLPLISGSLLPGVVLTLAVLGLAMYGVAPTAQMTLSVCFGIFLHISLYYVVLMPLLPLLRRHISARACAMLWLIPNYLYLTMQRYMEVPEPLFVIRAPGSWVWALFGVWLAGFASVMLWKTLSHLRFRRQVLKGASPVTDGDVLELWRQEIEDARIKKPKFRLVVSPNVSSPLTVGLFRRWMKVVLPRRPYSQEELRLIFRHEIIHIGREDSWSKFFLMFCTAMCWFNPLMWAAMGKSADDLELSCDETVLLGADEGTRRRYAELLLSSAGDGRGFTTCLSAAASSMRYRLKSIVQPRRRHSGAVVVGLMFFVLCMTCGYVALAYGGSTGEDVLFQNQDHSQFKVRSISPADREFNTTYVLTDEAAFNEYLAGLEMDHLTGNYSFSRPDREFTFLYDTPEGTLGVVLSDRSIKLTPLYGHPETTRYYLPEGTDWDYLGTVITAYPAMNIHLNQEGDAYGMDISATLNRVTAVDGGKEQPMYESGLSDQEYSGVYGHVAPYEAVLSFSCELAGPLTVEIENWDRTEGRTVTQDGPDGPMVVPLPAYPAHYKVCADFVGQHGGIYRAEFRFEIGSI